MEFIFNKIFFLEEISFLKKAALIHDIGKLIIPNQNGFMYLALDSNGDIIDSKTRIITLN